MQAAADPALRVAVLDNNNKAVPVFGRRNGWVPFFPLLLLRLGLLGVVHMLHVLRTLLLPLVLHLA